MPNPAAIDLDLADELAQFYADPLGFVLFAYPWGEPGTELADRDGPDAWQREFLIDLGKAVQERGFDGLNPVKPIRESTASGHGIGKSTLTAWVVNWIMSTRPHAQGTVTANTSTQLKSKTWAQIRKWTKLSITAHWFEVGAMQMYHRDFQESWFCVAQTCREENSEAFAGQHAATSTSFYVFDEASAVPDGIWEVAEGGLTDGESMIFAFGNPTRSAGKFYRITFGSERNRWNHRSIDSRTSAFTNKEQIAEWVQDYGEDSDFVRVRVRGLPPNASDAQFIDAQRVYDAQKREAATLADEPLVVGVDFAWGGEDKNVIRFRRGLDARSLPAIKIAGEFTRDPSVMVVKLADVLVRDWKGHTVHTMFVDSAGIAGPVVRRLRELGHHNVIEVNFGAHSPSPKYANMRAFMYGEMKEWLLAGAIDRDEQLETDLTAVGYTLDKQTRVLLEDKKKMKERGCDSPDDGDALACTFAASIKATKPKKKRDGHLGPWS